MFAVATAKRMQAYKRAGYKWVCLGPAEAMG